MKMGHEIKPTEARRTAAAVIKKGQFLHERPSKHQNDKMDEDSCLN